MSTQQYGLEVLFAEMPATQETVLVVTQAQFEAIKKMPPKQRPTHHLEGTLNLYGGCDDYKSFPELGCC